MFTLNEAWHFVGGEWKSLHPADAHSKARLLSRAEFDAYAAAAGAGKLPTAAFQPADSES